MKFYLDIYFAVNAAIDFFLLCLTGRILHLHGRAVRLCAAALLGGAAAVIPLFLPERAFFRAAVGILTPGVMLLSAFGALRLSRFFKAYAALFCCSFAAGGLFALLAEHLSVFENPKALFAVSFAVFFSCFFFFDLLSGSSEPEAVEVLVGGTGKEKEEKKLHLLCDSGCLVREPIGGRPVILLSPRCFDRLFPPESYKSFDGAVRLKRRLVPIKTAGGSTVISAVAPEKLAYIRKNAIYPCAAMIGRAESDSFAGFDGVFPRALLK